MVMNKISFFALVFLLFVIGGMTIVFAQLSVDNPSEEKILSNIGLSSPLIAKISDKGIYNITIKSGQSSVPSGLNFEVVFVNATSPVLSSAPGGAESNTSLDKKMDVGFTVPSVIEHVIPVESFDIKVSSPDGRVLFTSTDESPRVGRILENININYTGNISISLSNIVPDSATIDAVKKQLQFASNQTDVRDSVEIQTQVAKT
jgi:hypothetical protein